MSTRARIVTGPEPVIAGSAAWAALGACLLAVFMQMLDMTIVNTALPSIARELAAPGSAQVFVVVGYSLAFAGTLMTAARIGESIGRRRVFIGAMAAFTVASVWCGLAHLPGELIAARAAQGLSAAAMSAQVIAIISAVFPKQRQPLAFGLYGAAAGLAAIAGPLLGGAVIASDPFGLGWRAIFLLNVPLCVLGLLLAHRHLHVGRPATTERLDVVGAALATCGLVALLYPLAAGREQGWPPQLFGLAGAGLALLVVFVWHQRGRLRSGESPLLRIDLFADRGFAVGSVLTLLFFAIFAAFLFTVSVTAQSGLGFTALRTGILVLPFAVGGACGALTSPVLVGRMGSRALTLGVSMFAVAIAVIAVTVHPADAGIDLGRLAVPVFAAGAGMGLFAAPLPAAMMAGVAERATGSASGTVPTVQQIGSSVGVAMLGSLFFRRVDADTDLGVGHAKSVLAASLSNSPAAQRDRDVTTFTECAESALRSPTPHLDAHTCPGAGADLAGQIAAAHTFLAACVTVLWVVAATALALVALSLALPRKGAAR
ncbi:MFS transporter [Nocardia sputorum]|uniref:MFS transporter n=1 Tax=Nocardia sputorum TaxID=2984338 RepID=A0ABN6U8U8_9NOCA|nr:MFS transporter [Nocardia sputorum]BDU01632.1 MFS transporter [Nocardia sputorum]